MTTYRLRAELGTGDGVTLLVTSSDAGLGVTSLTADVHLTIEEAPDGSDHALSLTPDHPENLEAERARRLHSARAALRAAAQVHEISDSTDDTPPKHHVARVLFDCLARLEAEDLDTPRYEAGFIPWTDDDEETT